MKRVTYRAALSSTQNEQKTKLVLVKQADRTLGVRGVVRDWSSVLECCDWTRAADESASFGVVLEYRSNT